MTASERARRKRLRAARGLVGAAQLDAESASKLLDEVTGDLQAAVAGDRRAVTRATKRLVVARVRLLDVLGQLESAAAVAAGIWDKGNEGEGDDDRILQGTE